MTNDKKQISTTDTAELFEVYRDNKPALEFYGECIASVSSSDDKAMGSMWSGETGRWTELALYKTTSGKYVCEQIGRTRWQGERDRFSAEVCDTLDQVRAFFGHRWLAKELYEDAGIKDVQTVD